MSGLNFSGVFAPVTTPFGGDGAPAWDKLQSNIAAWNRYGLGGVVALGSTGEYVHLSFEEKVRALETAKEHLAPGRLLIAGTGCSTTRETVALSAAAAKAGADALLVIHPHYYRNLMTEDALERFYLTVADASPVPVLIYNMPSCTGMDLSAGLIIRLAAHGNITGMKESGGNIVKLQQIIGELDGGFAVITGSGSLFLPALAIGACGGILALADIAPQECLDLLAHFKEGRMAEARDLQLRMTPVNNAVTGSGGIPALKAAMDMLGLFGGSSRPPLLPCSEATRKAVASAIAAAGLKPLA